MAYLKSGVQNFTLLLSKIENVLSTVFETWGVVQVCYVCNFKKVALGTKPQ